MDNHTAARFSEPAHIIVFGNEKGGSGKSTSAMHVAIALLKMGYKVGTIDLDARQGTMTRYMTNRFRFIEHTRRNIPNTYHMAIQRSQAPTLEAQQDEERDFLIMAMQELGQICDFIVIDTPGTDSYLSRLAHSYADTLVTPMNDSFVDLDLLAAIDGQTYEVKKKSVYTNMVKQQEQAKIERGGTPIHWIVMRNRLGHLEAKNKREIGALLEEISGLCGFDLAPGFGERVIFKELFLKGLTLLDLEDDPDNKFSISQIGARQEVRKLLQVIAPEKHKPIA